MKIRVYKKIQDNTYTVVVTTTNWSQTDVDLFREFGEPEIDIGTDGHVKFAKVMTQFPVKGVFTGSSVLDSNDLDAEARAVAWKDDVIEKIKTAVEAQRQLKDDFTGEEIYMV